MQLNVVRSGGLSSEISRGALKLAPTLTDRKKHKNIYTLFKMY